MCVRPRHRWEDNINMDFREVICEGGDLFCLSGHDPVARCFEHGNEPSGFIKSGGYLDQLGDYSSSMKILQDGINYKLVMICTLFTYLSPCNTSCPYI
jgi:hypothetical protein